MQFGQQIRGRLIGPIPGANVGLTVMADWAFSGRSREICMGRPLPPLILIQTIESVTRLGSLKRAALEMNVTPSAISHRCPSSEHSAQIAA